ncbi:MAG: phosphatase PAP2 family protein, partial [Burkholderiaceae bacterium]
HSPDWMLKLAMFASQQLSGLVVAGTFGALVVAERDIRQDIWQVLLAMALAWALARVGQHLLSMPRPFALQLGTQWIAHGNSAGFPSTHASVAFAFATAVAVNARRWHAALPALAAAALIAWSRVCLGLHFPSDVIAGLLVGLFSALVSMGLWRLHWTARGSHHASAR